MTEPLTPEDAAVLRMLAGAHFLGGSLTLPSGRTLTPDEAQALTSAYAPATGETDKPAHSDDDAYRYTPPDGGSVEAYYLASGGDPNNQRTRDLLREVDRGRGIPPSEGQPAPSSDTSADQPRRRRWL